MANHIKPNHLRASTANVSLPNNQLETIDLIAGVLQKPRSIVVRACLNYALSEGIKNCGSFTKLVLEWSDENA